MKPLYRGIAVAVLHCLIVLSLAGKYAWDREHLPRVWVQTSPLDPNLWIRGRYLNMRLEVEPRGLGGGSSMWVTCSIENGHLIAAPTQENTGVSAFITGGRWVIAQSVAFFIPEHVPDPSRRQPGEELWVEVSVPPKGLPRPLRLGVKKDGILTPLP